jgi:hypothetical protein
MSEPRDTGKELVEALKECAAVFSNAAKEPREFWVNVIREAVLPQNRIYQAMDKDLRDYIWSDGNDVSHYVHVIEKSAYDTVVSENQKLREALEKVQAAMSAQSVTDQVDTPMTDALIYDLVTEALERKS